MSEAREKARALLANATPGPWTTEYDGSVWCPHGKTGSMMVARTGHAAFDMANAALIAAAPGLLAALCDENDALERGAWDADVRAHDEVNRRIETSHDLHIRLEQAEAQEAALRAELTAEVKRLKAFEAAELQRCAILDAMNGGSA